MTNLKAQTPEELAIVEARREYKRNWRAKNRDKIAEHNRRFYAKLVEAKKEANK